MFVFIVAVVSFQSDQDVAIIIVYGELVENGGSLFERTIEEVVVVPIAVVATQQVVTYGDSEDMVANIRDEQLEDVRDLRLVFLVLYCISLWLTLPVSRINSSSEILWSAKSSMYCQLSRKY